MIGKAVRLLRINAGLSQSELAKSADLSTSYIGLIERDYRDLSLSAFKKIAKALNKPLFLIIYLVEKDTIELPQELKEKLSYELLS